MQNEQNKEKVELPAEYKTHLYKKKALHIVPLGGVGEIGMNMMAYHYKDEIIVVDCGGLFPDSSLLGIDLVISNFNYLRENSGKIKALILTHGHEDHIGAVPFFLQEFNVPVYGTRFTLELIKEKLLEHDRIGYTYLNEIKAGEHIEFEHFRASFLSVNHSICDAISLALDTPEGLVVHTGDFRIDTTSTNSDIFDFSGFSELGRRGVLVLLSDSTNVERPGFTRPEREVAAEIDTIFHRANKKIFVSLFASSIPRIQHICDLARRYGRKIHIAGRSLESTTGIARNLGLLKLDSAQLIDEDQVAKMPPEQVCILVTGSQGEPRSVLTRIALNNHKELKVNPGDIVILSSRIIPGHERSVSNILNHLSRCGAEVFTERTHIVHTSGHGHRGELATMLNLIKPRYFIPVHGEHRHLVTHGKLAVDCGVSEKNIMIINDGDVVQFKDSVGTLVDRIETGRVYVDGKVTRQTLSSVDIVIIREGG